MDISTNFSLLCQNPNVSNSTSELWLVQDKVTGQVSAAFLLLILVVGLPWNLLVVLTIIKEKLYHQPAIILLLQLAVNDFLWMFFVTLPQVTTGFAGEYVFGGGDRTRCLFCDITGRVGILVAFTALGTIALMSFDRFLYIYKPLHYERLMTSFRMVIVVMMLWLVMIVLNIVVPLAVGDELVFSPPFLTCLLNFFARTRYVVLPMGAVFVAALVVFNLWVVGIVWRNIRDIYRVRCTLKCVKKKANHQKELCKCVKKKRHQKQLHLFQVFGALLGSTLITWLPILVLFTYLQVNQGAPSRVIAPLYVIYVTQIAVHPIIETVLIKDVREPMKHLIFCGCGKSGKFEDPLNQTEDFSLHGCWAVFLNMLQASMVDYSEHNHHGNSDSNHNHSSNTASTNDSSRV